MKKGALLRHPLSRSDLLKGRSKKLTFKYMDIKKVPL
jgi:hypothetical protein